MERAYAIVIVILICALLLVWPQPANAAYKCPVVATAWAAQLDILESGGVHYLIDPLVQGLPSHVGNVANLKFASRPDRWLVGGVKVSPAWHFKYHITYWDNYWKLAGDAWFATLAGYDNVYFYFIMPAGEADHPNCGYGSIEREAADALLKPRR